ncbi:MAG: hypothetical protein ACI9OJ_000676 [Myxococcota bacterium]|jgi:hypothetical protein
MKRLLLGLAFLGCSASGGGTGTSDVGQATQDAATLDTTTLDTASIADSGTVADDTTVPRVDTSVADSGPTVVPDVGSTPDITVAADVGPEDVGPEDVGIVDAGAPVEDTTEPQPFVLPEGLTGIEVDGYPQLIDFNGVTDENAVAVGPSDVKGNWTVMWFYPAANTFG